MYSLITKNDNYGTYETIDEAKKMQIEWYPFCHIIEHCEDNGKQKYRVVG